LCTQVSGLCPAAVAVRGNSWPGQQTALTTCRQQGQLAHVLYLLLLLLLPGKVSDWASMSFAVEGYCGAADVIHT
jgi:hypothetical protein